MPTNFDLPSEIIDLIHALDPAKQGPNLPPFVQKFISNASLEIKLFQEHMNLQKIIRLISREMNLGDEQEALLARAQVQLALEQLLAKGGAFVLKREKKLVVMTQDQKSIYEFDLERIRGKKD